VLDAVGAGELPDAGQYGDEGSDTLGNVARAVGGLDLPSLEALGLGNVGFRGTGNVIDEAVGEHAVDIHQQEAHARRTLLNFRVHWMQSAC